MQAILDLERVIQVRVVDQAFPAHCGARLLEVHAHDQIQRVGNFRRQYLEALGVLFGCFQVVDRARADHDEQAVIIAIENVANHFATLADSLQGSVGQRDVALELIRCDQSLVGGNVEVVNR